MEYDKQVSQIQLIAKELLLFRVVESEGTTKPRQPHCYLEGAGLKRVEILGQ